MANAGIDNGLVPSDCRKYLRQCDVVVEVHHQSAQFDRVFIAARAIEVSLQCAGENSGPSLAGRRS